MSNALNVRLVSGIREIAQGDTASTIVLELLDENKLVLPYLDGKNALIEFIDHKGEVQYQINTFVFDSRVEFNVDTVLPAGTYTILIRVDYDDKTYIFPSNVSYWLRINKSALGFYNVSIDRNGIESVANAVYQKLEAENEGFLQHISRTDNPHNVTKEQVGLGNVENVRQASKEDFDKHVEDQNIHITPEERKTWNEKAEISDIEDAIGELNFVKSDDFNQHINDEGAHWQEGEREQIQQEIATAGNEAENNAKKYTDEKFNDLQTALNDHIADDERHLTPEDRERLDNVSALIESDIDLISASQDVEILSRRIYELGNMLVVTAAVAFTAPISAGQYLFRLSNDVITEINVFEMYDLESTKTIKTLAMLGYFVALEDIDPSDGVSFTTVLVLVR